MSLTNNVYYFALMCFSGCFQEERIYALISSSKVAISRSLLNYISSLAVSSFRRWCFMNTFIAKTKREVYNALHCTGSKNNTVFLHWGLFFTLKRSGSWDEYFLFKAPNIKSVLSVHAQMVWNFWAAFSKRKIIKKFCLLLWKHLY